MDLLKEFQIPSKNHHSAHVEHLCYDQNGTEIIILGLNLKHQNISPFGGLNGFLEGCPVESPMSTAIREYGEETLGALYPSDIIEERIQNAVNSGRCVRRVDSKGLIHWHFFIHDLIIRLQSNIDRKFKIELEKPDLPVEKKENCRLVMISTDELKSMLISQKNHNDDIFVQGYKLRPAYVTIFKQFYGVK